MVDLHSKKHWNKKSIEINKILERNKEKIIKMYKEGMNYEEISSRLNVGSSSTISRCLFKWGVRRSKEDGLKITHKKTKGRTFSEKQKKNLSEVIKRSYVNNPELRRIRSENNRRYWKSMTKEEKLARCSNGLKTMQLHAQQKNVTSIELKVKEQLEEIGIRFVHQKQVCGGKYILDFYIPSLKLAIECNGDYWHNLPDRKIRDEMLKEYVELSGRNIIFIWEHEINDEWFWIGDYITEEGDV